MDYNKLKEFRNSALGLRKELGLQVVEVSAGYARMEMGIDERHVNPIGSVHGGAIYALADSAGGTAAMSRGSFVTTVTGSINYLNPAINVKKLIADTRELKAGKNILVYDVAIRDESGQVIAEACMTYYSLHKPFE